MDEITIGDKIYISSKRAAKITGYAKDYVGQLCREGRVEARLVGRNWYVLEVAIKEHRFGKDQEEKKTEELPTESSIDPVSTWKQPQYVTETPVAIPNLVSKGSEATLGSPVIADMQSAWREWFEDKKPLESLPSGQETFKDGYLPLIIPEESIENKVAEVGVLPDTEESVHLNKIEEIKTAPEEERVEIKKTYSSRISNQTQINTQAASPNIQTEVKTPYSYKSSKESNHNGLYRTVILVCALSIALTAAIGTGYADSLLEGTSLDYGVQKTILDFLGGKSEYKSSL